MRVRHRHRRERLGRGKRRDCLLDRLRAIDPERPCRRVDRCRPSRFAHGIDARRQRRIARHLSHRSLQPHLCPLDAQRLESGPRHAAQAIEARFRLAAVGVEHPHSEGAAVIARGQQQQPVAADGTGAIGQRARDAVPCFIGQIDRPRVDHRKVVAGAVTFDEVEPHALASSPTGPTSPRGAMGQRTVTILAVRSVLG